MKSKQNKASAILLLGLAALSWSGCDYRWNHSDREQTRQTLVRSIGLPGLDESDNSNENVSKSADGGDSSRSEPNTTEPVSPASKRPGGWVELAALPSHQWEIIYLGNRPVGYTRRSIELATTKQLEGVSALQAADSLLCIEAESRIRISRKAAEPIDQTVMLRTIEKPSGELIAISGSIDTGVTKRRFNGQVEQGSLSIQQTEDKVVTNSNVPWDSSLRGPFAIEQSLRLEPMKPKELRTVRYLDPFQMAITESRLEALSETQTVDFDGRMFDRIEIENRSVTQGRNANSLLWIDADGIVRKSYTPGIDRQTFDCDPVTARYVISKEEFDATTFKELPLLGSYAKVPETGVATFRVASDLLREDGRLSNRTNQKIQRVNDRTWDIVVSQSPATQAPSEDPVEESDLASAGMIDWKDPAVQRWINNQKTDGPIDGNFETSPVTVRAAAARAWIAKSVARIGLDRNLQNPAMTLRERKGDCIDHAILLTTVLRGIGIPARIAIGFRAEPSIVRPTCQLHTWVEFHNSQHWIPIDSFIDSDTVPVDRIKISESSLPSINAYEPFLSTIRLIPDIEISARTRKP